MIISNYSLSIRSYADHKSVHLKWTLDVNERSSMQNQLVVSMTFNTFRFLTLVQLCCLCNTNWEYFHIYIPYIWLARVFSIFFVFTFSESFLSIHFFSNFIAAYYFELRFTSKTHLSVSISLREKNQFLCQKIFQDIFFLY